MHLSDDYLAEVATNTYDFTCSWKRAYQAVMDECADEGITGERAKHISGRAVNLARCNWEAMRLKAGVSR